MIVVNAKFLTQKISGVQRFAIELSKRLKKSGAKVIFVTPKNIIHKELAQELNALKFGYLYGHLWEQIELPIFLKINKNPLLLNLTNTGPIFYNNFIIAIHDLAFIENKTWFSKKIRIWYNFLIPRLANKSLRIITVSHFSKSEISNKLKVRSDKICVVPNAVFFNTATGFNYQINLNKKRPYILCVASMDPRKNLNMVINAFKIIEKKKDIDLILVGDQKKVFNNDFFDPNLINQSNIKFTGYIDDQTLIEFYSNARLFIYLSFYEGFGLPPLEAMACGCPVLVSEIPSLKETCKDAALYCNPNDVNDVVNKSFLLLDNHNKRQKLSENGILRYQTFSWDNSINIILKLLNNYEYSNCT